MPIVKVITHRLYFISVANCLLLPTMLTLVLVKTISCPQPTIQMAKTVSNIEALDFSIYFDFDVF